MRCFANACPSKWSEWLHLAEFWYTNSPHSAIGCTRFEALHGYSPRRFGIASADGVSLDLSALLREKAPMNQLLQQHLLRGSSTLCPKLINIVLTVYFKWGILYFSSCSPRCSPLWHHSQTRSWPLSSLGHSKCWLESVLLHISYSCRSRLPFILSFTCLN